MTKYGIWIRTQTDKTHYKYACSNCKRSSRFYKFPFCPFCGSEMDLTVTIISGQNGIPYVRKER